MDSVQGSKMHWDLNAGELYDVLLDEKKLIREINHTFFTMVPKSSYASSFSD